MRHACRKVNRHNPVNQEEEVIMARRIKEIPMAFLAGEDIGVVKRKINDTLKVFAAGGYKVRGVEFRVETAGVKKAVKRRTRTPAPSVEGGE